jgi:hypothetical protein
MKKHLIFFIAFTLISCNLFNPPGGSVIDITYEKQILEDVSVVSIAFERDGTAWMGTLGGYETGLIRYGTDNTASFFTSQNSILSDSSTIWDIAVDSDARVWIANEGLVCYQNGSFTRYDSSNSPISVNNNVRSIAIDSNDKIWFVAGGLISYDNLEFTVYTTANSDLPSELIRDIKIDNDNNIWLLYPDMICKFDGDTWTSYSKSQLDLNSAPGMLGDIDINSENVICGILDYSLSSLSSPAVGKPVAFTFDGITSNVALGDSSSYFMSIFIDSDDNIWCTGIHSEIRVYNADNLNVFSKHDLDHSPFTIKESPDGKIWISGGDDGVYIYRR